MPDNGTTGANVLYYDGTFATASVGATGDSTAPIGPASVITSGQVAVNRGGTGASSASVARSNLDIYSKSNMLNHSYQSSTALDVFSRLYVTSSVALSRGGVRATLFTPSRDFTVSNISTFCVTGGADSGTPTTSNSARRMGIAVWDGTTNFILLGRTANDSTLWNTSNTLYTRALEATPGYPSTVSLTAGVTYALFVQAYNTNVGSTFVAPSLAASARSSTNEAGLDGNSVSPALVLTGSANDLVTSSWISQSQSFANDSNSVIWARLT